MAQLATLEGTNDDAILQRLFNTNDVFGVLIFGPNNWNKVKANVADAAAAIIAKNRGLFGRFPKSGNRVTHDVLDTAFGFNDTLGVEVMGGNEWRNFKNSAKTCCPCLGMDLSPLYSPKKIATQILNYTIPKDFSAAGLAKFFTGYQGVKQSMSQFKDITGLTEAEEREKATRAALEQAEREKADAERLQQLEREYQLALNDYNLAMKNAENIMQKTALESNPQYQQSRTTNLFLIGGLGVLAIALLAGRK